MNFRFFVWFGLIWIAMLGKARTRQGAIAKIQRIIADSEDVNLNLSYGRSYLHILACFDDSLEQVLDLVYTLLKRNANIEKKDHIGMTPLMVAIERGSEEVAMVLLDKGARANDFFSDGSSLCFRAIYRKKYNVFVKLVDNAAVFSQIDLQKKIPIVFADGNHQNLGLIWLSVEIRNTKVIDGIIRAGADINGRDCRGRSVLHVLASMKTPEIIELLVERGIVIDSQDDEGITPLLAATEANDLPQVEYFL